MRFFNVGDRVKIDPLKIGESWDDLPEDLRNFTEAFRDKILEVKRVVKDQNEINEEGEYILSFEGESHESSFYGNELVLWSKEWDN